MTALTSTAARKPAPGASAEAISLANEALMNGIVRGDVGKIRAALANGAYVSDNGHAALGVAANFNVNGWKALPTMVEYYRTQLPHETDAFIRLLEIRTWRDEIELPQLLCNLIPGIAQWKATDQVLETAARVGASKVFALLLAHGANIDMHRNNARALALEHQTSVLTVIEAHDRFPQTWKACRRQGQRVTTGGYPVRPGQPRRA